MLVSDIKDGKLITLSKAFDSRLKILNLFYFLLFFLSGCYFLNQLIFGDVSIGIGIFLIVIGISFYIASYRFANKAVMSERILINQNTLEIINKGLVKSNVQEFEVSMITKFRHLEIPETTPHPLAGKTFDYLGFQTTEKVINNMYGEKRLSFEYNGIKIFFGENVYSWDYDEIKSIIQTTTNLNI
jgi:hypothetical protein